MPFGMKNAPATFQRMINQVVGRIDGCEAYIDDVVIHSTDWETHLNRVQEVLTRFADVKLTVNLSKSEFGHAEVVFLGHAVGNGQVKPLNANTIYCEISSAKDQEGTDEVPWNGGVLSSILSKLLCNYCTAD